MAKKTKDEKCKSTKMFNGKREACVKNKGHPPKHQDILGRTWK